MPNDDASLSEDTSQSYYDTPDVDGFYAAVWGGDDIHTGTYESPDEPVAQASLRTIEHAADTVADLLSPARAVLDLGSGYGGATRYLAERFGCRVTALNISESQNRRHRRTNAERGLDHLVEVVTGSFHDIPFADESFDVVWSQEAFCHSGDRPLLLREAVRVLKPDGALVFTDLMAREDASPADLEAAVARLGVDALATPAFYRRQLDQLGLSRTDFDDRSGQLVRHYERITEETRRREQELRGLISPGYVDTLLANLPLWVDSAHSGHLRWGIFHCRRG
ncbi:methyltransferase domain-containing protein [Streptomyces sp. NPDC046853]|uniref:methyltransferase domain-containing protein n=1 Tax=Streptomyces sp. NPDC046853 TaxID=3154920 RepID=UPI0033DBE470